jgi:membrane associated rhomboid family serine protease
MNEPTVQIAVPAFSRSMKTLSVLLAGVWLVEALVSRTPDGGGVADPMGPFALLTLIPSRVVHGEVWRLFTHPLLHDPSGVQGIVMTAISLWFFGGAMESRWGLPRTLKAMALASVVAALAVIAIGAMFTPFWTQRTYGPLAATAMLAGAWGISEGTRSTSFLGIVSLSGRQFTAIFAVMMSIGFLLSRSPASVLGLVGLLVGAVLGNVQSPRAPRARRESGPKLRVIKGGVDPRDLPN